MAVFAVFDVETTGLSAAQGDRVVELAAVVLDDQFRVVRLFDSLIRPQRRIPAVVTRVHGISDAHVQQAPTFAELLPELMTCLTGVTHLVAHNATFDLNFLAAEMAYCRLALPATFQKICTMQMARKKAVAPSARLASVAAALRIPSVPNTHRAIVDASITARVLSLLYQSNSDVQDAAIAWPGVNVASSRRQHPRDDQSVSLHRLAQLGLNVRECSRSSDRPADLPSGMERRPSQESTVTAEQRDARKPPDLGQLGIRRPHPDMNESATWSWYLFTVRKQTVSQIAALRCMTEGTIYTHLRQALSCRVLSVESLASRSQILAIAKQWDDLPEAARSLNALSQSLNSTYPVGLLNCVISWLTEFP